MSSLYADAIIDAAKLKELALKNAEAAVIESITPKLKKMIDEQLLREDDDVVKPRSDDDDDILLDLASDPEASDDSVGLDEPAGVTLPDEEGKVTLDLDDFVVDAPSGDDAGGTDGHGGDDSGDLFMSTESAQLLAALLGEDSVTDDDDTLRERIDGIVKDIKAAGGTSKLSQQQIAENLRAVRHTYFRVRESVGLSDDTKSRLEEKLERLHETLRRTEEKMTKTRQIHENDLEITISGLPDSVEADEVDVSVEAADDDDSDSDDEQGGLGDLEGNDDMADEVYEMDDMKEADELDEGDLEITVSGLPDDVEADSVSVDVAPADDDMGDLDADAGGDDMELSDDDVVEIPEAVLRNEIARIRRARLNEEDGPGGAPGPAEFDDFGDASKEAELFTDYDDSDLNKNEARRRLARRSSSMMERRVRRLAAENKRLTKELSEANLFNSKMVYANRLLQREGMSPKLKARIVETLDRARSIGQLKTAYRGIVESLARRQGAKNGLNESARPRRVLGSASKPTTSGSPKRAVLQEANETVARWEVLAGMKNTKETV